MDARHWNQSVYRRHIEALNGALNDIRQRDGLGAALEALVAQQFDAGFVEDDLRSVRRYRVYHPTDRSRSFLLQYNPRRALRHAGAGRSVPPPNTEPVNGGCFLCEENIAWQQRGLEVGFGITLGGTEYRCFANPFPLMPVHVTVAASRHVPQAWSLAQDDAKAPRIDEVVSHLVDLSEQLPSFVVFFNGPGAGASIPSHLHFQLFKRPGLEPFPLESAPRLNDSAEPAFKDYPITCAHFEGSSSVVAREGAAWLSRLSHAADDPSGMSVNLIAVSAGERSHLYAVPRHSLFSYAQGLAGLVGGLEILGELVLSTDLEKQNIDQGHYSYASIAEIIAAVEPPRQPVVAEFGHT